MLPTAIAVLVALSLMGIPAAAQGQRLGSPGAASELSQVRGPRIWLGEAKAIEVTHHGSAAALQALRSGQAQALAIANGDLDADGIEDLVVSYASGNGGFLAIHRGNLDAFAPQSEASHEAVGRGDFPAPFLSDSKLLRLPVRPDFIALGNFNGKGYSDLIVAARGDSSIYLLANDGRANFSAPKAINVGGPITALAAGDFGRRDIYSKLLVGISTKLGSYLMVYTGTLNGLGGLSVVNVPAATSNIHFAHLGDIGPDAIFLSGGRVEILHSSSMKVEPLPIPFTVESIAIGSFVFDRNPQLQIAALDSSGSVHVVAHNEFDPRTYTKPELQSVHRIGRGRYTNPLARPKLVPTNGWRIIESFPNVAPFSGQAPVLLRTRISDHGADDVMVLNSSMRQMTVIAHPDAGPGATSFAPGDISYRPYNGSPTTALAMRTNIDGRSGIVALHQGQMVPSILMPLPDPTFFPNEFDDPTPPASLATVCNNTSNMDTSSPCSLREAVLKANSIAGTDTIMLAAGTYTLSIPRQQNNSTSPPTVDYSGNHGALYVNDSLNIVGAGQNSTIIQGGASASTGVDMVMAVNEDINPLTNATASISNLTIQFGRNTGSDFATGSTAATEDGDGGCMEFDTGTSGNASLTLTNVTLQHCSTTNADGGGIVLFNFLVPSGTGTATISNSIIRNNAPFITLAGAGVGIGGGIENTVTNNVASRLTLTNSQVLNNTTTEVNQGSAGAGGGILLFGPDGGSTPAIHNSIISGNQAAGDGGGILTNAGLVIDQGTVISNNSAGSANVVNNQEGGGIWMNVSPDTATLSKVTIIGNSATGDGGGIRVDDSGGTVNISFSRFAGNTTSGVGSNLSNRHDVNTDPGSTVTATNNWWGSNSPNSTIDPSTSTCAAGAHQVCFDPFIVLAHRSNPVTINTTQSTTLTADMSKDNHGNGAALSGNLTEFVGLPVTFGGAGLGTIPQAQPETSNSSAQATATFNAGNTAGSGTATANVDQETLAVNSNNIAAATEAGSTVTITTVGAHNFAPGEQVTISSVGVAGYNGTFSIASTPSSTTFTYTASTTGLAASSGGTAGIGIVILQKGGTTTTVTSSVNPSVFLQSITFTATVSPVAPATGTPTGTVNFLDNGSPIGTGTLSGGVATFATPGLNIGNHTITTSYAGDGNFNGSTGSLTGNPQVVNKSNTAMTVTSSVNPSAFGQSVTFSATVSAVAPGSGPPSGTVTFFDNGSPIGTGGVSSGIATFTTSALTVGNHTITTSYPGDGNFNGSTGSLTGNPLVVNKTSTSTIVTSSAKPSVFGQSVTYTATVSPAAPGAGTPLGTVTFLDGGSPIGTGTLSGGIGTFTTSALVIGNHTITTTYGGDGNFNGGTGSLTGNPQVVTKADTVSIINSSQNPQIAGQPVTFTAAVSPVAPGAGTPTGSVTFFDAGAPIGNGTLSGGIATFPTSTLTAGSHTITTSYIGDGNFNGSSGSLTGNPQVITQASTTTTLTASQGTITLGDTVTFTATVNAASGTATGVVTFFDGNTPLGSGALNQASPNQASFTTSVLSAAASPHSITAVYQGATAFEASTASPISEIVNSRSSAAAIVSNPPTVVVGQPSTATVTLTDSGSVPPGTPDTFATTGAPATGRTGFISTPFADDLILVSGGTDANNNVLSSSEIYSVSNGTFSSTGSLNSARTGAVAVLLPNGKVLVAGGSSDGTANGALNTAELFDLSTGTFTPTSRNMGIARLGATATLLNNGRVLLAGGTNSGGVLNSAELYDPNSDSFTFTGNLNAVRAGASATLLLTGKVLVAGGSSDGTANGALISAEVFDPTGNSGAGTFTSVGGANPILATGRWQPEAALLLSGKVLIAGGENSGGALTSADAYDPVADNFTASSHQMSQARANGSAVALPSGMVLLAGGTTSQAVDLYDADSDNFDVTGSLQQSDTGLVLALLNNGQVLVVGLTTAPTPASDAELYAPSFNPLGTVAIASSEATDIITGACTLTPSTSIASTCTSTVTPANVATSPHTIAGTYSADAVHLGSNNTASLTVNKTDSTTTITSPVNPSVFGQSVTFTATVSAVAPGAGSPAGTVAFLDGGSPIGSGALSGRTATFTTSTLTTGNHTITTSYGGDANFNGSTGSLTGSPQVVSKANAATTLTSSQNPTALHNSITFTATVSAVAPAASTPTGTVAFLDDANAIGNGALSGGVATFTTSGLTAGNHTITASYAGDGNFNASTGSLTGNPQVVTGPPVIAEVFNPIAIPVSGTSTLTFTITNPTANTAETGVAFTDTLPTGLVVATPNGLTNSCVGTATATAGGTAISLSGGSVVANSSCTVVVNVVGAISGQYTDVTGAVTSTNGGNGNTASANLTVATAPTLAKAFGASTMLLNGSTSLTFTIMNPNTALALTGVGFNDALPSGLTVASPAGFSTNCSGGQASAQAAGGITTITFSGASLPAGGSCTLALNVKGIAVGVQSNIAGPISSNESGQGSTSNTAVVTVIGPPAIAAAFGAASINLNATTSLTFTITNPNSTAALTGLAFTDALPSGLVVANPNALAASCGTGTVTTAAGSGSISLSGATVAAAGSCTVSLNVQGTAGGHEVDTTGAITSSNGGSGNQATAALDVLAPDLALAKKHTGNFSRGQTGATYTITVSNVGFGSTSGTVTVTDTLPSVANTLIPTAMNGNGWTCVLGTLTCTRADALAAGSSYPDITLTVNVPEGISANVTNTATVSGGSDTNSKNNVATDMTHVGAAIQISPIGNLRLHQGGTGAVSFTVESTPGLGPITFSCSDLPSGTACAFNPPSESALSTTVTLTISSRRVGSIQQGGSVALNKKNGGNKGLIALFTFGSMLFPVGFVVFARPKKNSKAALRIALIVLGFCLVLGVSSCGSSGTPIGGHLVTLTATGGGAQATATFNVLVYP